jgi:hypothetical protein
MEKVLFARAAVDEEDERKADAKRRVEEKYGTKGA